MFGSDMGLCIISGAGAFSSCAAAMERIVLVEGNEGLLEPLKFLVRLFDLAVLLSLLDIVAIVVQVDITCYLEYLRRLSTRDTREILKEVLFH
jgi:hypothetical protein